MNKSAVTGARAGEDDEGRSPNARPLTLNHRGLYDSLLGYFNENNYGSEVGELNSCERRRTSSDIVKHPQTVWVSDEKH